MTRNSKELKFYMQVDVAKSATKNEDEWVFEGLASTSNLDLFGDVVYPESFQNSIDFFKSNGKIFYNHNYARKDVPMEAQTPIGIPLDATIREGGLYIKAALNKSHPLAQKIWKEFLTNPDPKFQGQIGLSIGAKALGQPRREYSPSHGKIVNFLPDLLLYEVSMTPTPVNPDTKTWVSVLKSVMDDSEVDNVDKIIEKKPDSVVYDSERNVLVVKSTIENEDGSTYNLEQYINVKEDVRKAMDDLNKKPDEAKKAEPGLNPEDALKPDDKDASPTDDAPQTPDDSAAPTDDGSGLPDAGGEDADAVPDEGGDGLDAMFGGGDDAGVMPGGEPGTGDDIAGDPTGAGSDISAGQDMDSASVAMLSDKIDTIQDAIISMANDLATLVSKEQGGAVEGSTEAPVDNTIIKNSIAEPLKPFYEEEGFKTLLKSTLTEILSPVLVQTDMVKKSVDSTEKTPEIVDPKVALSTSNNQVNDTIIIKSAYNDEPIELDKTVLKGLLERFVSIRGSGMSHSVARGDTIAEAERTLGITSNQFRRLVQDYTEKGEVKL